jgi:hypothetical protein
MKQDDIFEQETGASTGDVRENDPHAPGFTDEHDRLFRSLYQHANELADRSYESVRPAYKLGFAAGRDPRLVDRSFDDVERDLEGGWLNVRTARGDWQSVRDFAREGFERGRQLGFIIGSSALGSVDARGRAGYADPLAGGYDPTSPESPEQRG